MSADIDAMHTAWFKAVPGDWSRVVHVGTNRAIAFYGPGVVRFVHRCDRSVSNRGAIICAPALRIGKGHTVTAEDPLTITPSILCPDCGDHGFVTDGRWIGA